MNAKNPHRIPKTRRQTLGAAGVAGGALLMGFGRPGGRAGDLLEAGGVETADALAASCTLVPAVTEGPYFLDDRLRRSDIRSDSSGTDTQEGIPLSLTIQLVQMGSDGGCTPYEGATVDIWHANSDGVYSGIQSAQNAGGTDTDWLRGYQVSDSNGKVAFSTIFPGWYRGRAIHIHFKVRTYDGSSQTYEFTSQLFFSEATIAKVYAVTPYSGNGTPDTSDSADSIYGETGGTTVVPVTGSASSKLAGSIVIGLSGLPDSSDDDAKVGGRVLSSTWIRTGAGRRTLRVRVRLTERTTLRARLLRGGDVVAGRRFSKLRRGTRTLHVPVPGGVKRGSAQLSVTLRDTAGNAKTVTRHVHVPKRLVSRAK